MSKSLFAYFQGSWKKGIPYVYVGNTWKKIHKINASTSAGWKPEKHVHIPVTIAAIASTCTTIGYTSGEKCTECNELLIEPQPIPVLEHQWTEWTTTKQPTETSEGEQQRSCLQCSQAETTTVPKLNHTHNYISVPAKSATCTQTGNKAYYFCNGCQTYFDDKYQTTTWSALEIAEDPTAHTGTLDHVGTQSTHSSYSCCGATTSIHSYTVDSGIKAFDASCTSPQYNFKRCVCGYNPRSTSYIVATGSALGHTGGTATCTAQAKCSRCGESYGEKNSTNHSGSLLYMSTKDIHTMYSCCSAVASSTHSITQQGSLKAVATCTSPATYYKKCACGYEPKTSTGKYGSVDATNHTGTVVNGGTVEAHTKYSCCGATVSSTHSYTEQSNILYAAATCKSGAKYYKKCSCGYNPQSTSYLITVGGVNVDNHAEAERHDGGQANKHSYYPCCGKITFSGHSYTEDSGIKYSSATCKTPQQNYAKCTCGYNPKNSSFLVSVGSLDHNAHTYSNGKCILCGLTEPSSGGGDGTGGGTGGCVFSGTKIALTENTSLDIAEFKGGMAIDFCNPDTLEHFPQQTVAKLFSEHATEKVIITLEDGKALELTPNHVVLTTEGFKDYLDNSQFPKYHIGDKLATIDGYKELVDIQEETIEQTTVYNIATENSLMVANGIIVAGELEYDPTAIVLIDDSPLIDKEAMNKG